MQCDKCRREAVIYQKYSGLHLCHEHFIADFESKAKKAIRFSGGLAGRDHVAVAGSGDYKSIALMHFLNALTSGRRGIRLMGILTGSDDTCGGAEEVAASLGIRCIVLPRESGEEGDSVSQHGKEHACGGFWAGPDSSVERIAAGEDVTRIACGTSLDDAALSVLTSFLKGEPGKVVHQVAGSSRIPRLFPFLHIPDREIALYARLTSRKKDRSHEHSIDPFDREIKNLLDEFSSRHPSAPHSLVNLGERLCNIGALVGRGTTRKGSMRAYRQDM